MAYTKDGIMAQVWVSFGQGTGAIRVSQEAALELNRWYYDAITQEIIDNWESWGVQLLDRIRAIGSLAGLTAIQDGSPTVSALQVWTAAQQVQANSMTPNCPPVPPPPS